MSENPDDTGSNGDDYSVITCKRIYIIERAKEYLIENFGNLTSAKLS